MEKKFTLHVIVVTVILTVVSYLCLSWGVDTSVKKIASYLFIYRRNQVIAAIMVGAGLSVVGLVLQSYFNNKLASPNTLGIVSFSGVGAALAIVLGLATYWSFIFAFGAVLLLLWLVSHFLKHGQSNVLLIGILFNLIAESLIMIIKHFFAALDDFVTIDYWFWGSLEKVTGQTIWWYIPLALCIAMIMRSSFFLDMLSQGLSLVKNLTSSPKNFKRNEWIVILSSSIIVAICAVTTGRIGYIGLIAPHACKKIFRGIPHRKMLILTILYGALFITVALFLQIVLKRMGVGKFPISMILALPGVIFIFITLAKGRV